MDKDAAAPIIQIKANIDATVKEIREALTETQVQIWILEAIPATHVYVSKKPREKIPRAFAWKMILPFSWARCRTLFVGDNLALPLETLTPTKAESKSDWRPKWGSVEEEEKEERVPIPCVGGDTRISTLTQIVSSLQGTIDNLESRLLALEGDEREFGVLSDGDIPAYMSPGPSYTSPASTAQKSLSLANRYKLRIRRTPLKLKSPMRCYSHKMCCTIPLPTSTTMPPVMTISVPMTTTKLLRDSKDAAKDVAKDTISVPMTTTEVVAGFQLSYMVVVTETVVPIRLSITNTLRSSSPLTYAAAQDTFCTEDELQFIGMKKGDKPNYALPDLSKIKRNQYPTYSTFEKKTDCYLDCLPKGRTCEPSFWDILYPGGEKAEYLEEGKLGGLHINAFIELMIRKRPRNAHWTLGLSELVVSHIESRKLMSMVSVVDALRATIDGTNPRYPSWHKIS
nr:hypothetical protein [Tanacetum cinerariifolium]